MLERLKILQSKLKILLEKEISDEEKYLLGNYALYCKEAETSNTFDESALALIESAISEYKGIL